MRFDKKGVSPVVGTILLIIITISIAGLVGYFAYGQRPGEPAPTLSVEFDNVQDGASGFTITHLGGDTIESGDMDIKKNGIPVDNNDNNFSVGQVITVDESLSSGDEIFLVHIPSDTPIASTEVD